jgi:hypothetical protein
MASDKSLEHVFKSTRLDNTNYLCIWVQNLEGIGSVVWNSAIVSLREYTSLLVSVFVFPKLEAASKVEEVLIVNLVDMRENT